LCNLDLDVRIIVHLPFYFGDDMKTVVFDNHEVR
jgi:hypothetical protein